MTKVYGAPGKALLAGGYLVLDPQYSSYVTALSSRMHVVIDELENGGTKSTIHVSSPQFIGEWEYVYDNEVIEEVQKRNNPFIQAAISTVLAYFRPQTKFNLQLKVFSDSGYHTQENTTVRTSANGMKKFLYHQSPIEKVAKTGLGSSAGLVSSITGALMCHFYGKVSVDDIRDKIHNAAQIGHCYAQKKVGSGFDVATAIYGSIEYQRFNPKILDDLFSIDFLNPQNGNTMLKELIDNKWDFKANQISLPPKLRLIMGDIKGGSNTPSFVSKVLAWKKSDPVTSDKLYHDLDNANKSLIEALHDLNEYYKFDKDAYLKSLANNNFSQDPHFAKIVQSFKNIRIQLKKLTRLCGADIEPDSQTKILDLCQSLPGVLGGVVPGAGGYDAICLLVSEDMADSIIKTNIHDLQSVSWLYLKEESEGIKEEDAADYIDL